MDLAGKIKMATYLYEADKLTPDALEQAAGLPAGSIELTMYPEGAVEIRQLNPVSPPFTDAQKNAIKVELAKHGLPKGKKPKNAK